MTCWYKDPINKGAWIEGDLITIASGRVYQFAGSIHRYKGKLTPTKLMITMHGAIISFTNYGLDILCFVQTGDNGTYNCETYEFHTDKPY